MHKLMSLQKESVRRTLLSEGFGMLRKVHYLSEAYNSTTYLVKTSEGKFILVLHDRSINKEVRAFMQDASNFYTQHGFPVATLLWTGRMAGNEAVLWSYHQGKVMKWKEEEYYLIGQMMASMHVAGSTFKTDKERLPFLFEIKYQLLAIEHLIPSEFRVLQTRLEHLIEEIPADLPSGLIHGDIWPKNVLFSENKIIGILDLYNVNTDYFAFDIGAILKKIDYSDQDQRHKLMLDCFMRGYLSIRMMDDREMGALDLFVEARLLHTIVFMLYQSYLIDGTINVYRDMATINLIKLQQYRKILVSQTFI